jgi:hypothetical protein
MEPVGLAYKSKKGWQVIHRCLECEAISLNKVAVDTVQPDDQKALGLLHNRHLLRPGGVKKLFKLLIYSLVNSGLS